MYFCYESLLVDASLPSPACCRRAKCLSDTAFVINTRALSMGMKPKASFKSWTFIAVDPFEDLLLGPTFGAAKVNSEHALRP